MNEKFTKEEFNEYMKKIKYCKPFNEKEWNEFQYVIKGRIKDSPNHQAYLDYSKSERIKRQQIVYKKIKYSNHEIRKYPIPNPTPIVINTKEKIVCYLFFTVIILKIVIIIWFYIVSSKYR